MSSGFDSRNVHSGTHVSSLCECLLLSAVLTDFHIKRFGESLRDNVDGRLDPVSVATVRIDG